MDLKSKFQEGYKLLAAFSQFIADGTILAFVNFWFDDLISFYP
jgi:hypothetical protein